MRGGGDSGGMGMSCGADDVIGSNQGVAVANPQGNTVGGGTLTVGVGGAHVEQHIDACEHSPPGSCPQPS
jgi:hypothetical protein